jgi:hypothetical protein
MRISHRVQSTASFVLQNHLISLRSSSSCIRLFHCLPVTSNSPDNFHSIMCFRRQFLRKIWPIHSALLLFAVCRILLFLRRHVKSSHFSSHRSKLIFFILLQHHISKLSGCFWSNFRSVQISAPHNTMLQMKPCTSFFSEVYTRWFKYDRDYLCVNKSQIVPVIFEPPCTWKVLFYWPM